MQIHADCHKCGKSIEFSVGKGDMNSTIKEIMLRFDFRWYNESLWCLSCIAENPNPYKQKVLALLDDL